MRELVARLVAGALIAVVSAPASVFTSTVFLIVIPAAYVGGLGSLFNVMVDEVVEYTTVMAFLSALVAIYVTASILSDVGYALVTDDDDSEAEKLAIAGTVGFVVLASATVYEALRSGHTWVVDAVLASLASSTIATLATSLVALREIVTSSIRSTCREIAERQCKIPNICRQVDP